MSRAYYPMSSNKAAIVLRGITVRTKVDHELSYVRVSIGDKTRYK